VLIPIVLGLIVTAVAEIAVIVAVGQQIGPLPTVLLLLGTALVGGWLLRREGARAWRAFTTAVTEGRPPAVEALDGVLALMGGALMVLPGFISDLVGLLLVVPFTRRVVRGLVLVQLARRLPAGVVGPLRVRSRRRPARPGPVVEGQIVDSQVVEGRVVDHPDSAR
jgi:UPF0716 protein FxsA